MWQRKVTRCVHTAEKKMLATDKSLAIEQTENITANPPVSNTVSSKTYKLKPYKLGLFLFSMIHNE